MESAVRELCFAARFIPLGIRLCVAACDLLCVEPNTSYDTAVLSALAVKNAREVRKIRHKQFLPTIKNPLVFFRGRQLVSSDTSGGIGWGVCVGGWLCYGKWCSTVLQTHRKEKI